VFETFLGLHLLNPFLKDFAALHPIDFAIAVVGVVVRGNHCFWRAGKSVNRAVGLLQGGLTGS
jgi:hypothetical protein